MGPEAWMVLRPPPFASVPDGLGPVMTRQVFVTEQHDGQTLLLRAGDSIELQLAENPASGYRWAFSRLDETRVEVEKCSYAGEDSRPGTGGLATWTLRTRAPARTLLELKCWRHWEGDRSIVGRFSVTLDIKPA